MLINMSFTKTTNNTDWSLAIMPHRGLRYNLDRFALSVVTSNWICLTSLEKEKKQKSSPQDP